MATVSELIPQKQLIANRKSASPGLWWGTFSSPAPALTTDMAWVTLPDVPSIDNLWGPCFWEPRIHEVDTNVASPAYSSGPIIPAEPDLIIHMGRILIPVVGDIALVAFDNRRNPWIVRWWPA